MPKNKKNKIVETNADRRKKCDEQKPECLRCIKYGTKCLGYGRDQKIVIYSAAGRSQEIVQRNAKLSFDQHAQNIPSQGITSGPSRRAQIFATYVNVFFPTGAEAKSSVDLWHYLISNFSALPNKSEMLEKSLAALACAWLGKQNNDAGLLKYGVQLYNVAIRQMASLITRDAYSDDIIYTTVLFQEIEVS